MEPVTIIAETDDYFVINKPPGLAVEPPSRAKTLLDWLVEHNKVYPEDWPENARSGVVHRLDTDTSGVMLWAKNPTAQIRLRALWQGRRVKKTYLALVIGETSPAGNIEYSIERDNRKDRQRVTLLPTERARPAITNYQRLNTGKVGDQVVSLVECHPITGRTHQLRVHLKAIGHPIIGDGLYGEKKTEQVADAIGLKRQFLHASELSLPSEDAEVCYRATLPEDLAAALLRADISQP